MTTLGLYVPGRSWLHRLPAGVKLTALLVFGLGSVLLTAPWQVATGLVVIGALFASAGIPVRRALSQVRPLLWTLAVLAGFHVLTDGWVRAVMVVGTITLLVLLAGLVTLTTRTSAIVDAIVRACGPLRQLGVDPDRVGLMLALGIRSVPVIIDLAGEIREAQRARGLESSARAFAVPLLVRSVGHAQALGDALVARGIDD